MDDGDGVLQLANLRQKDIRQDYEMMREGVDNVCIEMDSFDRIQYNCDHCRDLLTEWNFVYCCYAKDWDQRHDVCLLCVSGIIKLNRKLGELLVNILKDNLDCDCIQTIVNYVIGRVIRTEFHNNNKRKLDGALFPEAKRQKLSN